MVVMYGIERASGKKQAVVKQNSFFLQEEGIDIEYLTFPLLEDLGVVKHLFSTRVGGCSEGIYASMNLSFHRGDEEEAVVRNYDRIAKILGTTKEQMVSAQQTHTTNIRIVTKEDAGKGIVRPLDYENVDGLITGEEGLVLVTTYADCVPLYFVDVKERVIGLAHSGWRGTVAEMGMQMVRRMESDFSGQPENIYAAIGPSICRGCYEVSLEVAKQLEPVIRGTEKIQKQIAESGYFGSHQPHPVLTQGKEPGKYQLDLWLANLIILRKAGIPLKQITVTDVCTCHNPQYLFSHRASKGKRGNLGAFLMLTEC